jgi:YegS/Rv2252/BmrU family lipid kinase
MQFGCGRLPDPRRLSAMARRILIIANPAAGRGRRAGSVRLRRVVAALERHGCAVVVRESCRPGDAEQLARLAEPAFDVIVAAGGDGTVNEVVNGLCPSSRPLAVLPLGTGNVLASEIGMPHAPEALAQVIAEAPARPIWPGIAGGRLFIAMAGAGFDAEVLGALGARLKRQVGKLAFVWAISRCLFRYRRTEFVVETADGEQRAVWVIVVTGRRYAGNFVVASAARLAEPTLHVVLFRRSGRGAAIRGLAAIALGALHHLPEVSVLAMSRLSIAPVGGCSAGLLEIDGDILGALPIAIGVADAPLLLVQPAR